MAEARGGKLNGQRQAVEPATDLDDGRNSRRIQGKVVVHGLGALGEELHRTGCGHCFLREPAIDIRHAQARHAVHVLAIEAERFATRRQHREVRAGTQQFGHDGRGSEQMLVVVQHQQQAAVAQGVLERIERRALLRLAHLQHGGDSRRHERRVEQRRQRNKVDAVGEIGQQLAGRGHAQARLADAAGAGEGQQARIGPAQPRHDRIEVRRAADQVIHARRKVGGGRVVRCNHGCVQGLHRADLAAANGACQRLGCGVGRCVQFGAQDAGALVILAQGKRAPPAPRVEQHEFAMRGLVIRIEREPALCVRDGGIPFAGGGMRLGQRGKQPGICHAQRFTLGRQPGLEFRRVAQRKIGEQFAAIARNGVLGYLAARGAELTFYMPVRPDLAQCSAEIEHIDDRVGSMERNRLPVVGEPPRRIVAQRAAQK